MALRCCRESGAVTRIALNRPLEEPERGDGPLSVPTVQMREGAQVQIVGVQVIGWVDRPIDGSRQLAMSAR